MDAFKSLINYVSNPTILFTAILVGFPFVFPPTDWFYKVHKRLKIDKLWTSKGLIIMIAVTIAFFVFGLGDENFKKIVHNGRGSSSTSIYIYTLGPPVG